MRRIERLALVAFGAFACSYPIAPAEFERYEPPAEYSVWYAKVQACAGLPGPRLGELDFWQAPGASVVAVRDSTYTAYFEAPNKVVVAGFYTTSRPAITHEFLHAILMNDPHHESSLWEACLGPR